MSLVARLHTAERRVNDLGVGPPKDIVFSYEITGEEFDTLARNNACVHGKPPDRDDMLRQFSKEQVDDVWRRHYGYYQNGKLIEPTPERIKYVDKLSSMTVQDWYEGQMNHIIRFPHRISFDLAKFGLSHWVSKVSQLRHLDYAPSSN